MNNLNEKMERDNNRIFSCEKIGIDCEWCENKIKCLNKQFYSEKLDEAKGYEFKLYPYINDIVKLFSEKIDSHKCYEISVLPNCGPSSDKYIKISLKYNYIEHYGVITDEQTEYGWKQYIKTKDCLDELFDGVYKKLKEKYNFSKMKLYYRNNNLPWTDKEIYLYFIP